MEEGEQRRAETGPFTCTLRGRDGFELACPVEREVVLGRNTIRGLDTKISRAHLRISPRSDGRVELESMGRCPAFLVRGGSGQIVEIPRKSGVFANDGDLVRLLKSNPQHVFEIRVTQRSLAHQVIDQMDGEHERNNDYKKEIYHSTPDAEEEFVLLSQEDYLRQLASTLAPLFSSLHPRRQLKPREPKRTLESEVSREKAMDPALISSTDPRSAETASAMDIFVDKWSCSECSLMNSPNVSVCDACMNIRPSTSLSECDWICNVCVALNNISHKICRICKCPKPGDINGSGIEVDEEAEAKQIETLLREAAKNTKVPGSDEELARMLEREERKAYMKMIAEANPRSNLSTEDKKKKEVLKQQAEILVARRRRMAAVEAAQDFEEWEVTSDAKSEGSRISSCTLPPLGDNVPRNNPRGVWVKYSKNKADFKSKEKEVKHGTSSMEGKLGSEGGDTKVCFIQIPKDSEEFKNVTAEFRKTCKYAIMRIEAVKSPVRLGYYNFKRAQFRRVVGSKRTNERWLWHGTTAETIKMISHQGFLRQFMTESDTGKGVTFTSLALSAAKRSKPDKLGMQRMFLCRALIGDYHKGYKGCILPDPKPGKRYEVHESVVDNVFKPKTFVVFQDDQAYPEYVLTFKAVEVDEAKRDENENDERSNGPNTDPDGEGKEKDVSPVKSAEGLQKAD